MTALIGNLSLSMAVLVCLVALLSALASAKFESLQMLRVARWLIGGFFVLLSLASGALVTALVTSDFQFEYVAHYTEKALPFGYKLAAFWAGQEGSLLLWAWLLAVISTIAAFTLHRGQPQPAMSSHTQASATLATIAAVCGFFAALMLFAANPFKIGNGVPADGHGLNPMLQDPGMIAHPPLLFLGYAGYTIPFALLIGALVAGRKDNQWILATRRWALISWLFLSIGILLGAQWAYVELGWGGYWAWDPVENASLLPWLTGTALLHSIMVQQQRGMFKKWNSWLIAATFILCIFGTYLTRSGVIQSVHAFGESLIGTFFLVFLGILTLCSVLVITVRRRALKSECELEALMGKEGFFLATNVLLAGMTLITLIGTIFPLISNALAGQQVTVGPNFYNKVVAPLGLLLVALMALGPVLAFGKDAGRRLVRGSIVPGLFAAAVMIACVAMGLRNGWALIAAGAAAAGAAAILADVLGATVARIVAHGENPLVALLRALDNNHRRCGGQIVHAGVILIVLGVTGSSLFSVKQDYTLKPGESAPFAGRTLTLAAVHPVQGVNFEAAEATLTLTDGAGAQATLSPQMRQYNKWEQLNSQVAIHSNWQRDVYVTLASVDPSGGVTIQAILNPLVSWIWAGGIVLSLGGILSLLPRLLPRSATDANPIPAAPSTDLRWSLQKARVASRA